MSIASALEIFDCVIIGSDYDINFLITQNAYPKLISIISILQQPDQLYVIFQQPIPMKYTPDNRTVIKRKIHYLVTHVSPGQRELKFAKAVQADHDFFVKVIYPLAYCYPIFKLLIFTAQYVIYWISIMKISFKIILSKLQPQFRDQVVNASRLQVK